MDMAALMDMAGPGLVGMADGTRSRLRISHGIQDARIIRLRHLDNSHPSANAKHPQPGQAVASSSLSSWRTRWWMSSRMGRTACTLRPAGSVRSQSR
ncbi:MAG: hypothetical protein QOG05_2071 [Streptosporangiaceae bacterium]|jgi:hypothetical protein|nr:hypothetical protein [Streptosporangiaceae bacterium]